MASAVADTYSVVSGGTIYAGIIDAVATAALMGDSLTDDAYTLSNFYLVNGANGGKVKLLANSGVTSNTVSNMLSRVDNLYTDASPGMAGLSDIGWIFVRAGTNDARVSTSIASLSATYTNLLNKLATYARRVVILSVPPLSDSGQNAQVAPYNAWLAAFAADAPEKFLFVDDCADVRNVDNSQKSVYFVDGVHFNRLGVATVGASAATAMASYLSGYASPLSDDAADVYPAQPQWFSNPTMAGTGGTKSSGCTGVVVNGLDIIGYGGTVAALCSVVAADGGDANQTPWQRITPSQGQAATQVSISGALAGRTPTNIDPDRLDTMVEVRLTGVDLTKVSAVTLSAQANTGEMIVPQIQLDFVNSGTATKTYVLRSNRKRNGGSTPSAITIYLGVLFRASFGPAASVGTIDFRCITARG